MSLGIAFKGPEGIVLAADSRVTLTVQQPNLTIPATYDNATKLLRIVGQDHVGAVTYGLGAIGMQEPRTAHSYLPEFEAEIAAANLGRLSVQDFATRLSDFFMRQWAAAQMPANTPGDMIFLVGGYDNGGTYGRVFDLFIPHRPAPVEQHAGQGTFGIVWGGQREFTDRLIQGFDDSLPNITQQFLGIDDTRREQLRSHLKQQLTAKIPFAFLPLQDCVDVSIFLIRTTIAIQNWTVDIRGVGGAIDVATITRVEGFKPVQQKAIVGERPLGSVTIR